MSEQCSQNDGGSRRIFLFAGVGLQLVVLIGMIVFKAMPLWTGEPILLRVVPVDPRDMFRGDYVAISYDFSRIPPRESPNSASRNPTGAMSGRVRRST